VSLLKRSVVGWVNIVEKGVKIVESGMRDGILVEVIWFTGIIIELCGIGFVAGDAMEFLERAHGALYVVNWALVGLAIKSPKSSSRVVA